VFGTGAEAGQDVAPARQLEECEFLFEDLDQIIVVASEDDSTPSDYPDAPGEAHGKEGVNGFESVRGLFLLNHAGFRASRMD
jgi:hypothetical protein